LSATPASIIAVAAVATTAAAIEADEHSSSLEKEKMTEQPTQSSDQVEDKNSNANTDANADGVTNRHQNLMIHQDGHFSMMEFAMMNFKQSIDK
jgi:hypothetical protein